MVKPVTLKCGHPGCYKCLERLLDLQEQQRGESTALYPLCRTVRFGRDALMINVSMDRISSDLPLSCNNTECPWEGTLGEAPDPMYKKKENSLPPWMWGEDSLVSELPVINMTNNLFIAEQRRPEGQANGAPHPYRVEEMVTETMSWFSHGDMDSGITREHIRMMRATESHKMAAIHQLKSWQIHSSLCSLAVWEILYQTPHGFGVRYGGSPLS